VAYAPARIVLAIGLLLAGSSARAESARAARLVASGNAAYRAHRYHEAAVLAERAASLDPSSGEALLLAGLARFELGEKPEARRRLTLALSRSLDPEDRELAHTFLDIAREAAVEEEESSVWLLHLRGSLGGGYDDNVRLSPLKDQAGLAAAGESRAGAFVSSSLFAGAGVRFPVGSSEVEYGLLQITYPDWTLDGSSFQMHMLEWMTELSLGRVRLRLPLRGDASLIGFAQGLHPFEWSGAFEPEVIVGLGSAKARLGGGYVRHYPLDPELSFLDGRRLQVSGALELGGAGWNAAFLARYRQERLGQARGEASTDGCPDCTYVTSYSYRAPAFGLKLGAPRDWLIRPALSGWVEDRRYPAASVGGTLADGSTARSGRPTRRDLRVSAAAEVSLQLGKIWQLTARYDLLRNGSNLDGAPGPDCRTRGLCHPLEQRNYNYAKQTFTLELEAEWL
jgi:hypothetical protein